MWSFLLMKVCLLICDFSDLTASPDFIEVSMSNLQCLFSNDKNLAESFLHKNKQKYEQDLQFNK